MKRVLRGLWKENAGGSLVEYALLGVLIAIGVAAAVAVLTHSVSHSLSQAAAGINAGSKEGMVAGGGLEMLPSHRKWVVAAVPESSSRAKEVERLAASLEAATAKAASEASEYAKAWSSLLHTGGISGAQGAIVAGWTAAVPR